jgi:predicted kinase
MGTGDRPLLVVVTGPPASGKTSVAEELAGRLGVAFLSKDTFKEVLYEHLGSGDQLEPTLDAAALAAGLAFIVESNFDARYDPGPLRALADSHDARLVQVYCTRSVESLLARFAERAESGDRHPGHGDEPEDVDEVRADLEAGRWAPLALPGALVEVDLDDGDDVEALIARIEDATGGSLSEE